MKSVFNNSDREPSRRVAHAGRASLLLATGLLLTAGLVMPSQAHAQSTFWSTRDLLGDFFKTSQRVSFRTFDLDAATRQRLERRLGYQLPSERRSYTVFVAETAGRVDGYAVFDEELGQHLPITFAVKLSPSGTVDRQEIVAYREARGDEVRDARFRAQFVGKSVHDPLRTGDDVVAVSGASISSRAMAIGVHRALVLVDELVLGQQRTESSTARK